MTSDPYSKLEDALLLLVGHEDADRLTLQGILEAGGFRRLSTARPGHLDIDALVLSDVAMIIVDGSGGDEESFEVVRRLRVDPRVAELPVLVELADLAARRRAFLAGATDVLVRPFEVTEVLQRVRLLIDRARLATSSASYRQSIERELRSAARLTEIILPADTLVEQMCARYGVSIDVGYRPAESLSGDLWALLPIDDARFGLLVADVSGHGVAAAMRSFGLHSLVVPTPPFAKDPNVMADHMNRRLYETWGEIGAFTAAFYGVVDMAAGLVRSVGCGLRDGFVIGEAGDVRKVGGHGLPLGLVDHAVRRLEETRFGPGDTLVMYSDAVVESHTVPGAPRDEPEFAAWVQDFLQAQPVDPNRLASALTSEFIDAYGDGITDDLLLVSVHHR